MPLKGEESQPLYIQADVIHYDEKSDVLTAEGDVEVSQFLKDKEHTTFFKSPSSKALKERYLKADQIIYNRKTSLIQAVGNVIFIDEDGNVAFVESLNIDEAFDNGFVNDLKLLLADDEGRLTARDAVRKRGEKNIFKKVTYSPCHVCETKPIPIWQLRAEKVTHDQNTREMHYNNAFLDFFGVPVVYFPYFKHPDPGIKRKSGFLMPSYAHSTDLGFVLQAPYFWELGPHNDMTLQPIITTKQGPILAAEYRHRFRKGDIKLNGSLTRSQKLNRNNLRSDNPELPTPSKTRFHLFSKGRFELNDEHLLTFDVNRASDTTYLRRYGLLNRGGNIMQNKNLTSEAKLEQFKSNNYASVRTYAFQTDRPRTTPAVFPLAQYMYKSDPGKIGETYSFQGNFLSLLRKQHRPGVHPRNSSRATGTAGFKLPYVNQAGHLYEMDLQMRGDLYQIGDYQPSGRTRATSYSKGRVFPTGGLTWRYPLATGSLGRQYMVEPLMQFVASPSTQDMRRIPNEDSRFSELDDLNLFFINRMNGFDRTDTGRRFVYGLNQGFFGDKGRRLFFFLGQSYRVDRKRVDLIGDEKKGSDYVTRVQIVPIHWLKLHYRGRFNRQYLHNRFSEITANLGVPVFNVSQTIVFVDKKDTPTNQDIKQVNWQAASQITDMWNLTYTQSKNFAKGQKNAFAHAISAVYHDECFQFSIGVYRTRFRDRDIKPDTGVMLQLVFKNLGSFKPYTASSLPNITLRKLDYGA